MKVREMMAELLEKLPDDEVMVSLTVRTRVDGLLGVKEITRDVPVTDVLGGGSPVLLECEANIEVTNSFEVY